MGIKIQWKLLDLNRKGCKETREENQSGCHSTRYMVQEAFAMAELILMRVGICWSTKPGALQRAAGTTFNHTVVTVVSGVQDTTMTL